MLPEGIASQPRKPGWGGDKILLLVSVGKSLIILLCLFVKDILKEKDFLFLDVIDMKFILTVSIHHP